MEYRLYIKLIGYLISEIVIFGWNYKKSTINELGMSFKYPIYILLENIISIPKTIAQICFECVMKYDSYFLHNLIFKSFNIELPSFPICAVKEVYNLSIAQQNHYLK